MSKDDSISISVNDTSCPVLCGLCHKPISWIGEVKTETGKAGCIPCGNTANVKKVAQVAIEYAKDEGQLLLNRALRDIARKSKMMNFSGQTQHKKSYAFIVDLDGSEFGL